MVLLRHTLPDASWHFDWLIQRDDPHAAPAPASASGDDAKVLCAFRTSVHPAAGAPSEAVREAFDALALPDHRRLYLHYEGPLAAAPQPLAADGRAGLGGASNPPLALDRGSVARVASGWAQWVLASPDAITLVGSLGSHALRAWAGRRIAGDQWRFTVSPTTHAGSAEG